MLIIKSNWAEPLPFAGVAYNNSVYSSTGFAQFKVTLGIEFVPIPECPKEPPISVILTEWMDSIKGAWGNVKKALAKAREAQKQQAGK